jgi:pyochelin biosynthesis protein PchG
VNERPRVVVCGTKFGRVYLAAFRSPAFPFELAGILAQGSERSQACARAYQVPLYTRLDQLPLSVDIACVVVGSSINGGRGAELAQSLMARGIHVLQEHPLHHDELAECLRQARRHEVVYHLNTHYRHVRPVRHFIAAAQALLHRQRPLFVDAVVSFQTAYTLFDLLGRALGRVRPWAFASPAPLRDELRALGDRPPPFRSLDGSLAGVPLTLRIQHQLQPGDPDNHAHVFHRITIGTAGGNLTLVNTHGPTIWCPRPHLPAEARTIVALDDSPARHLDFPSATPIGPPEAPSYREILNDLWPAAVQRALLGLRRAVEDSEDWRKDGQYYLTLCRLWSDVMASLGPVALLDQEPPEILSADELMASTTFDGEM